MLINSPNCYTCLFSWYGLLIMLGGVSGIFSQTACAELIALNLALDIIQ